MGARAERPIVFLSHTGEDEDTAAALGSWIQARFEGAVELFSFSEPADAPGTTWPAAVERALHRCSVMLALMTPASMRSTWVSFEAGVAFGRKVPFLAICLFGLRPEDLVRPMGFLPAIALPSDKGESRLVARIARSCRVRARPRAQPLELPTKTEVVAQSLAGARGAVTSPRDAADLIREAAFTMDLREWPGDQADPDWVLEELARGLARTVIIPRDVGGRMLAVARASTEVVRASGAMKNRRQFDGHAFVRELLQPILRVLPSEADYLRALETIDPPLRGPLLKSGYENARDDFAAWNYLLLMKDLGERETLLKVLLRRFETIPPSHKAANATLRLAREVLRDEFDQWFDKKVRPRIEPRPTAPLRRRRPSGSSAKPRSKRRRS
jgi:hypothetical protein